MAWLPNINSQDQPTYFTGFVECVFLSMLQGVNKWQIVDIFL